MRGGVARGEAAGIHGSLGCGGGGETRAEYDGGGPKKVCFRQMLKKFFFFWKSKSNVLPDKPNFKEIDENNLHNARKSEIPKLCWYKQPTKLDPQNFNHFFRPLKTVLKTKHLSTHKYKSCSGSLQDTTGHISQQPKNLFC